MAATLWSLSAAARGEALGGTARVLDGRQRTAKNIPTSRMAIRLVFMVAEKAEKSIGRFTGYRTALLLCHAARNNKCGLHQNLLGHLTLE
jgi:hypothetical protein